MSPTTANARFRQYWTPLPLLLLFFATRLHNLTQLPLHNDEGLHLTRAVAVWQGHPFWDITDGKIINHWAIAAFYPQNAPDFVARLATVFVVMLGVAAGYAIARHLAGPYAGIVAVGIGLLSPYLFFYERLAQSDAEAAALVTLAVWGCLRLTMTWKWQFALWTGGALALAALMKFTAAPYALVIALILLLRGRVSLRGRLGYLLLIGSIGVVAFLPPMLYMALQGQGFFSVALDWVASTNYGQMTLTDKVGLWFAQLTQFGGSWLWCGVFVLGLGAFAILERNNNRLLLVIVLIPLALILILASVVFPRHFVVTMPLLVVLAGVGVERLRVLSRLPTWSTTLVLAVIAFQSVPFFATAYRAPAVLDLPDVVAREFLHDHSSGFGLREAMLDLPTYVSADETVIASMFPASCRRANFYALENRVLLCGDAPGRDRIEQALVDDGSVFVLVDRHPLIGIDVDTLDATIEQVAAYPRPGETDETATIVLVRLSR